MFDVIIPMGMRCNSAQIIRHDLKKDQPSMIFDWVQFTPQTMTEIISLKPDMVETYFNNFFSCPFKDNKNIRGDWLPHTFYEDVSLNSIIDQSIRRTNRLLHYMSQDDLKVYLTVLIKGNDSSFDILRDCINNNTDGNNLFLTANYGCESFNLDNHKNIIPETKTWEEFDLTVRDWIIEVENSMFINKGDSSATKEL